MQVADPINYLRQCATSMEELARRYYPAAITLAQALQRAEPRHLPAIVKNCRAHLQGYRRAMFGRTVETANHYVVHGVIFIRGYLAAISFESLHVTISIEPKSWSRLTIGAPPTPIRDSGSLFAGAIALTCRKLTAAPGTYLAALEPSARILLQSYLAGPSNSFLD